MSSLGLYDCQSNLFTCWKKTAKALDDWRCVVSGPFVASLWREYSVDGDVPQKKHQLWLCWGCHTSSLWGPCEHAYCCMEHEGHSSATSLPKAKPKGRPSRKAKAISTPTVPSQIVPAHSTSEIADTGQGASSSSTAGVSSDHLELRSLLRSAALGRFYQLFTFFGMTVGESHALMQALEFQALYFWFPHRRSSASSTASVYMISVACRQRRHHLHLHQALQGHLPGPLCPPPATLELSVCS